MQKEGIKYYKTFTIIIKLISYKALFIIAIAKNLKIKQMNVKIIFLYKDINEKVYIK